MKRTGNSIAHPRLSSEMVQISFYVQVTIFRYGVGPIDDKMQYCVRNIK